jgi:LuxR family transcriptional regulator, maltose regulon positive regulatory protein
MPENALFSAKFHPPVARSNLVRRPLLMKRLDEGRALGRPLALICAPAGFGKTTLAAQWIAATGPRAAWLALEDGDDDPHSFLRLLAAALKQAHPDFSAPPFPVRDAESNEAERSWLMELLDRMRAVGLQPVLVLDDYHRLRAPAAHALTAALLESRVPGLCSVIVTREDPPLPLARLRARGELTEIRERDLRFSPDECADFFRETLALSLEPALADALGQRAEGWAAGLQLAGAAVRGQADPAAFVAEFAGDDRYIVDYFLAEVLQREPEELRRFLEQTSILEKFSAGLCDAATGRKDSRRWIERLEKANLFLIPLDHRRTWYRYHGLFAGMLRLSLPPEEQRRIHQSAARWCAAGGYGELARHHQRCAAELARTGAQTAAAAGAHALAEPLTGREQEILRLLAAGYGNAEIAKKLTIAVSTAKRHVQNIYGKLGVGSRTQAIALAREIHLLMD